MNRDTSYNLSVRRGDIVFVCNDSHVGREIKKTRPAIVVGCDEQSAHSPIISVVMCTSAHGRRIPEHVALHSTPCPCIALCESVYTVDRSRIRSRAGHVTPQEMEQIDCALLGGLGLFRVLGEFLANPGKLVDAVKKYSNSMLPFAGQMACVGK